MRRVAVFAHFDAADRLSPNFLQVISLIQNYFSKVVIVSTSKIETLPSELHGQNVQLVTRPNFGYDFYSYKTGLEIAGVMGQESSEVLLANSSFSVSNPAAFKKSIESVISEKSDSVKGLTISKQIETHLQSYFVYFPNNLINNRKIRSFIESITLENDKTAVVHKYEVGLSKAIRDAGIDIEAVFRPKIRDWLRIRAPWMAVLYKSPDLGILKKILLAPKHLLSVNWLIYLPNAVEEVTGVTKNSIKSAIQERPPTNLLEPKKTLEKNRADSARSKVAVVVHAYYLDGLEKIMQKIESICEPFDIFITTPFESLVPAILEKRPYLCNKLHISIFENRGRDIGPFTSVYKSGLLQSYDAILKLHTKKSTFSSFGVQWNDQILDSLLGSSLIIKRNIQALSHGGLGISGPGGNFLVDGGKYWGSNKTRTLQIRKEIGASASGPELGFFAGSMFWFSPRALNRLHLLELSGNKFTFEPESGQMDGTLAHCIERIFCDLAVAEGLYVGAAEFPEEEISHEKSKRNSVLVERDYN